MKRIITLIITATLLTSSLSQAQNDSIRTKRDVAIYTFLFNVVPDNFPIPLVGFVNLARGNHSTLQAGFININIKDFTGLQASFVNTTFGGLKGLQTSFANTTFGNFYGLQSGFVNTTFGDFTGLQASFVNTTSGNQKGLQAGFVNSNLKNHVGAQAGFVNTTIGSFKGLQAGFVNTVIKETEGVQMSFVNVARKGIKGFQLGFINLADTVSDGVPIGFISVVRRGGFRALELSSDGFYPVNLAFKIGVPKFYTFFMGSYCEQYEQPFAVGIGAGTLIPRGDKIIINPEIRSLTPLDNSVVFSNMSSLDLNVRYRIVEGLQVAAGPTIGWVTHSNQVDIYKKPFFSFLNREVDSNKRIIVGARLAISYSFAE